MNTHQRDRLVRSCVAMTFLSIFVFPSTVTAQKTAWTPPVPVAEGQDWIKLVSGEWVRGEIQSLRDETLEFDSEKLDLLTLDWDDVTEIRSPRILQYVFDDDRMEMGTAVMQSGVVKILVGTEIREFPAAEIVSIVEGATSEWDRWSTKVSIGFVSRSGNTDQVDLNSMLFIRREGGHTRFDTNYNSNYGKLEGNQSVDNQRLHSELDVFLSQRLFATPASIELFSDRFQNINSRTTLGAGLGYKLVQGALDWYVQFSGGYVHTDYRSVEPGQSETDDTAALIPSTSVEWDPTGIIETSLIYAATISVPDVEDAFHHLAALMDIELYDILDFTVSITWDPGPEPPTARRRELAEAG